MKDLAEILAIARSVGWGASYLLRSYYQGDINEGNLEIKDKKDGPVTSADLAVSHYILDKLKSNLADEDFAYMSEETYKLQSPEYFNKPWVWIIDPLDGTRDFIDKTGEYAVHIALVKDKRPVLAIVACPELEKLYYATLGGGTFAETRDGSVTPIKVSERNQAEDLTLVVSRTHRDQRFNQLLEHLPCKKQKFVGSVGCKIATIIEQEADVYISLSGKSAPKDWDMAAPELILTEAGGQFTHFNGDPLQYNTGDVNQWGGLMASNGHCHMQLCQEADRILAQIDS
ncbi:3'(2'),5'-bisphosphate nucleotidase CysQ family protein [Gloeocapsopsis dulcis]|uniref:inositol-phosphate phosphatase n=1 Tax=Gloeocapsopsis dulcis AAB1 = 1H9 TaxID=1433147 RepID=A0A6N8G2Z5_9CHRO|nr:inositol monophosphatase family protein [Gloeocapsopsis dulcis]MUL38905.1 3'(2'),5'-bisphosphate nucleotidase CysQ [Gloeocapsopsis dulcis AAB1 = 1H9]WNN88015.1 inositol monophosphatase family protein [Gloeocapsopsis dulcis]